MRDDEPEALLTALLLLASDLLLSVSTLLSLLPDLVTERVASTLSPAERRPFAEALAAVVVALLLTFDEAETSLPFTLLAALEPVVVLRP